MGVRVPFDVLGVVLIFLMQSRAMVQRDFPTITYLAVVVLKI